MRIKRTGFAFIVGVLFAVATTAQTQSGAQAGAQASTQASAQTGDKQVQASGNAGASSATAAQAGHNNASLANGTAINAALSSSVDSKKAKPGDTVTAKTTQSVKSDGKTVIPRGSKLVGHVTQASARAKGDAQSALAIQFDRAILKNGREVPLDVTIQALAAAQSNAALAGNDLDTMGGASAGGYGSASGSGGLGGVGGVTSTAGGAVGTVTNTAAGVGGTAGGALNSTVNSTANVTSASKGAVGGLNAAGQLTSNSQGVFGLHGLNLASSASNDTQGSVITSAGKNVHLSSGTQMLLVSQAGAGAQGASKQPASGKKGAKPEPRPRPDRPNEN